MDGRLDEELVLQIESLFTIGRCKYRQSSHLIRKYDIFFFFFLQRSLEREVRTKTKGSSLKFGVHCQVVHAACIITGGVQQG